MGFFPTVELFPWDLYRLTAYEGKAGIENQAHNSQENNDILSDTFLYLTICS